MSLPPYARLLGIEIEAETGPGTPVLAMPFGVDVLGRPGFIHGGAIAGLLEMAAFVAVRHALAGEGRPVTPPKPVNFTVDFMRGGRAKTTRAQGIVSRLGTRIANVEAFAWQDDREKPVAAGRMTLLLPSAGSGDDKAD